METTQTILLTRPEAQSYALADTLSARFGDTVSVIVSPILTIAPTGAAFDPDRYGAFLFTSINGVNAGLATHDLKGRLAYCVGDRTAEAARALGMDARSAGGSAEDLIRQLGGETPPGPWLHISGEELRVDLAATLSKAGHPTDQCTAYVQVPQPLNAAAKQAFQSVGLLLPVFSPRSAAILSGMVPQDARVEVFALSEAVARAWHGQNAEIFVAARPNLGEMLELLELRLKGDSQF